ncbi:MAG TPA: zf-HC2 domain-containing protein, partial [Myxococcota bacterium]|nr:zf-HC2 domain-containing protein [Myxococcota bacterium]
MTPTPLEDERLTAYLDGELSPEEAAALENELDQRPELRHLLGELRIVREFMHKVGPENAPKDFMERVMDAVDMDAARGARRVSFSMPMLSMLAAAAMLFVMYGFIEQLKPPEQVAAPKVIEEAHHADPPRASGLPSAIYMAPAAYRFRGAGALAAVQEAAAANGGR